MSFCLFSPIYSSSQSTIENCSFLRSFTQVFDFGQKSYIIKPFDGKLELTELERSRPHFAMIALKVMAILTVIIPLIVCIGLAIYRLSNHFHQLSENRPLPDDIVRKILHESKASCTQWGAVSKSHYEVFKSDKALHKYKMLPVLTKHLHLAIESGQRHEILTGFAESLISLSQELALEAALEAIKYIESHSDQEVGDIVKAIENIAKVLVLLDCDISNEGIDRLIEVAEEVTELLVVIAKTIYEQYPEKSDQIFNQLLAKENSYEEEVIIFRELARINKSLEFFENAIDSIFDMREDILPNLIALAKVISSLDPQNAAVAAFEVMTLYPDNKELLKGVLKALPPMDSENAARVLKEALASLILMDGAFEKAELLIQIASAMTNVDPVSHKDLVEDVILAAEAIPLRECQFSIFNTLGQVARKWDSEILFRIANLAIKHANLMGGTSYSDFNYPLANIISALTDINPDVAFASVSILEYKNFKLLGLLVMIQALKKIDPEKALEIGLKAFNACPDYKSYIKIACLLFSAHTEQACQIADAAIPLVNSISDEFEKYYALRAIAKILASQEPRKALELINSALDLFNDEIVKAKLLITHFELWPEQSALILAKTHSLNSHYAISDVLLSVANSETSLVLIKEVLQRFDFIEEDEKKAEILIKISKLLPILPSNQKEIVDDLIAKAIRLTEGSKLYTLTAVVKVLVGIDPEKACALLELTSSAQNDPVAKTLFSELAKLTTQEAMSPNFMNLTFKGSDAYLRNVSYAMARSNPKKALETAFSISNDSQRFQAIIQVAKQLII